MAAQNTSSSARNSDSSEIYDVPIVPPQPVARKEYKEVVPDISMVSEIADNGSQQKFQKDHLRSQTISKYFQHQSELKTDMLTKSNLLLSIPDNLLHKNINQAYQQQLEIDSCVSKTIKDVTERTNPILDCNTVLPVKIYFNPACPSCITNCTVMTNKEHNGIQYALQKSSSPVLLAASSDQSDKDMRCKSENGEIISNKICCKHIESNVTTDPSQNSTVHNHNQPSCASNSKEPEMPQIRDISDCCCSKDQHSKLKKSLSKCERHTSLDSGLGESRKSEGTCKKEMVEKNVIKNKHILCPTCWKKTTCTCNFSAKKYDINSLKKSNESVQVTEKFSGTTNLQASSDELSSIWEYLKQQDEKINLIHTKVSNFLSQHESCFAHPAEENVPKATDSDIPYILNILEVHSDKIRELQDQINTLKANKQKPFANNTKVDESILNQAHTINCAGIETSNENIHLPCSHNVVCHEQRQKVTKTSTSTMTSFAIENNDKLVYHKQFTVVADVTREKKDSSPLPKEHDTPTTANSNSHKRKSHKLKCSPKMKGKTNISSNSSSDAPDSNVNQMLKTSLKSERKSKRASTGNKVPDERHVDNDWTIKDNNVKERKSSPSVKSDALKSHSRSSKQKQKNNTSPRLVDMAITRGSGNKKMTRQISTSSSSTNSEYDSPKQRQKAYGTVEFDSEQESTTKSKYGLSSKYLSIATKTYLDKFQLYLDKNNRTESS